jgi:hypothetical protein
MEDVIISPASLSPSADKGENTELISPQTREINNEELNPLEEAKKILKENSKLLEEMKKERMRIEKATAEMLINGRSYAGQTQKVETEEEKWKREAKIRYAGTGLDPTE